MPIETPHDAMYIAYCSGPLFCPEEAAGMSAIAARLEEAGFATFLPHRDGIEAYVMRLANSPLNVNLLRVRDAIDRAIFALDVYQLAERCDGMAINLNGRVPDEGAVVEASLAFALGRPVVAYKNDARAPFRGRDNSMLAGLYGTRVDDIGAIPHALRNEIERKRRTDASQAAPCSDELRRAIDLGRTIWRFLERLPSGRRRPEAAVKEIARLCREDGRRYAR